MTEEQMYQLMNEEAVEPTFVQQYGLYVFIGFIIFLVLMRYMMPKTDPNDILYETYERRRGEG